ncbi:methyltransferase [Streptomyces thinghirensis]|nr:methyltransferase [Streptomyces thinghirensis]
MDRRVTGCPLELVLGWAEFRGLRVAVAPGVFVPRRRTEFLVAEALAHAPDAAVVVDLCCGSGAVGAALAAALDRPEVHAADVDPAAVRCARGNLADAGGRVYAGRPVRRAARGAARPGGHTRGQRALRAHRRGRPAARRGAGHEPLVALDGGTDGLEVLREVAAEAPRWLAPGGRLLAETSRRQAPAAVDAFARAGLTTRLAVCDELYAHVVIGVRE